MEMLRTDFVFQKNPWLSLTWVSDGQSCSVLPVKAETQTVISEELRHLPLCAVLVLPLAPKKHRFDPWRNMLLFVYLGVTWA